MDCEGANFVDSNKQETTDLRKLVAEQADRVVASIEVIRGSEARRLESIIEVSPPNIRQSPLIEVSGGARVTNRSLLLAPLRRGVIPVIAPIGYMPSTHTLVYVDADEIILALTREFAGIQTTPLPDEDPVEASERIKGLQKQTSVDRIIVLDPVGGIPSADRVNGSHVFINLEQELDGINAELLQLQSPGRTSACAGVMPKTEKIALTSLDANQSGPRSNGTGIKPLPRRMNSTVPGSFSASVSVANTHLKNLKLLQRTLALLPPSSSALITTPEEAANSGRLAPNSFQAYGVGTRRQRNPLIHNLLTDKPIFSSSLPAGRLATVSNPVQANGGKDSSPTTFVKRGMPLTILPDPRLRSWAAPKKGEPELTLEDPRIDLPRLVHLIDDSFNRKLDVKHYLERVNDRIAGIIIAGEYEGGALLTWETPPGVPDDGSEESRLRKVPYLDKFAVLQRSQGAGGVADIVFNAMVRDCFPNGVCWRSRRDNPVNKWYFERARGTWKIPRSNWTMFWTTEGVVEDEQTFLDYEGVCKSVVPSWADKKAVID